MSTQRSRKANDQDANIKKLVKFIENLGSARTVDDVMVRIRAELKNFARVKEPILAFADAHHRLRLTFYQKGSIHEKTVTAGWSRRPDIRFNDVKDSQYLANIFGRPFARLLAIPIRSRRRRSDQKSKADGVLYLEHSLKKEEVATFLKFIEDRVEAMSSALDRLFLEQQLKDSSLMWERTFDSLQDPVAIFGSDGEILRANRAFSEQLANLSVDGLFDETIQHDGREYEVHSYPISVGHTDRPSNTISHYIDVTRSTRLKKQLMQGEKMAALGQLAGHIAHELNNPLTGIRSMAQLLIPQAPEGTNLKSDLIEAEIAAERCQKIITNLREFSTAGFEQKQIRVDLNDIVTKTLSLLNSLTRRFELIVELSSSEVPIFVEPHLTQQVIFNIVKNACEAMTDSGQLVVKTYAAKDNSGESIAAVSIEDSGPGIAPELREKVFEFFFTTKAVGEGTGLGLSMSRSIVERFGGRIEFDSTIGKGTTFRVLLPLEVSE